ncbi:coproporphyrinogen III oxidase [Planctomyces sp. SCGC AG-212-M04]|nr:coproporphyrinogen III oxidase [Planctomyces sp. SCGC AG-212-M04]
MHVPFCRHRCGYCDFTLVAGRDDLINRYLEALELELSVAVPPNTQLDTLFFGGGTPTHLSPDQLQRLFQAVLKRVQLTNGAEFSVEANPLDLTDARIGVLSAVGVNRVSVGVQSFQSSELTTLERDHSPAEATAIVRRLMKTIPNVGVDLIFGVPGQSLENWRTNLTKVLDLAPPHISTYGLTFEKGTAFWSRRAKGDLRQQPEELERDMYALAIERLTAAGYRHYELSNFAKPGFECRHNQVYWNARSYYAAGPGAASYLNGVRRSNHRSTTHWIEHTIAAHGASAPGLTEELSPEERAREALMLGLRQRTGIDIPQFEARFDVSLEALAGPTIQRMQTAGWLEHDENRLRLTDEGVFVADTVVSELLNAD